MAAGRTTFLFTALALLTVVLFTADLLVGSVAVAPADIWAALTGGDCNPAIRDIILRIRLLKAITALLAGAALAASGLQMQTLFRNPLAGPCWASRRTRSCNRSASPARHGSARHSCCWS